MPDYQFTHDTRFVVFPDVTIADDKLVPLKPSESDVVEVPPCSYWKVEWTATHPDANAPNEGVMLVARYHSQAMARDYVCEILWGRGYTGWYDVQVTE
jgi:hypothetical protein